MNVGVIDCITIMQVYGRALIHEYTHVLGGRAIIHEYTHVFGGR